MNKIIKKISAVASSMLLIAVVFIIGTGQADAKVAPDSISVKRSIVLNDIVTNHDHGFTIFTTSDGKYIYCLDIDKKPLVTGQQASLAGNGDAGLLYIMQNGYPNKEITGNDNIDMYITQAAVWWYMDETAQGGKMSNEFKNATTTDVYGVIPKYIKPMVAKAKAAKDTQVKPSMKVTADNKAFSLTGDGKYYESSLMSASLVGAKTYSVAVSGGTKSTIIVDENGNAKNTFNSSERFKVRVPANELKDTANISVKLSATGTVQKAKIYKPSDAAFQRVIGLYEEETPIVNEVKLSVTGGDTPVVVVVPNTSANIIFISVLAGVLAVAGGVGFIIYTGRKHKNQA